MTSTPLQLEPTIQEKRLHTMYGARRLKSIYGGGCIDNPDIMLVFMNPTAKNIASASQWRGLRAPWIGTRQTWKLLATLGLIDQRMADAVTVLRPNEWTAETADKLYRHIASRRLFITNLAKCTQPDARHLADAVFRDYLPYTYNEIAIIKPKKIIAFGNQVSSILLRQSITVSRYPTNEFEILSLEKERFPVYPTYYPVGQGQRNLPLAIKRIQSIVK